MNGFLVSNAKFEPPADGWVQVLTIGEFPNAEAGIVQVCDDAAFDAIAKDFTEQSRAENWPGMLVDYDHFSHQKDKPSGAAGWADAVERRGDGLWAHVRFTESGDKAVRGGEYRLLSPVLSGFVEVEGARKRPSKLIRLALTNDPNIQGMQPVSNRATGEHKTQEKTMEYKEKLTDLLGLNRDASDGDIEKAMSDLETEVANRKKAAEEAEGNEDNEDEDEDEARNRAASEALLNRIAELEREVAATHASKYDAVIADQDARAAVVELCTFNRGAVDKVIAALRPAKVEAKTEKPEDKPVMKPLFNRRVQPLPGSAKGPEADEAQSAAVLTKAQEILAQNRAIGWNNAWAQAKQLVTGKAGTNGE